MKKPEIFDAYFANATPIAHFKLEGDNRILEFFNTINSGPNKEHIFTRKTFSTPCRVSAIGCDSYNNESDDLLLSDISKFSLDRGSIIPDPVNPNSFPICGFRCWPDEEGIISEFLTLKSGPDPLNYYNTDNPTSRRERRKDLIESTYINKGISFLIGFNVDDAPNDYGTRAYIYEHSSVRADNGEVELVTITEILDDDGTPYKSRLYQGHIINLPDSQTSQNWGLFIYNEPAD